MKRRKQYLLEFGKPDDTGSGAARVVGIVLEILPSLLVCIWFFFFSTSCMPEKKEPGLRVGSKK